VVELRSGPYSAGKQAGKFLLQRLARGPAPAGQLVAEAEQEGIVPATLYRAARRLKVTKTVCWGLPDKQTTMEREEQTAPVEAEGQAVPAVAETDLRIKQVVAEVSQLITEGMGREIAIHRACRGDRELAAQVRKELHR